MINSGVCVSHSCNFYVRRKRKNLSQLFAAIKQENRLILNFFSFDFPGGDRKKKLLKFDVPQIETVWMGNKSKKRCDMKTVNLSQVNARARVEKYAEPKTKREKIMAKKKTINFVFRRCVAFY